MQAIDLNQDEGEQRDEMLIMDLVGMGETGGCIPQSSSAFEDLSLVKTSPQELFDQVIEQTLIAYSVDERLTAVQVLNTVDENEIEKLKMNLIEPLLKNCPPQLWSTTIIDFGNYPLNQWLNREIVFKSQMDEIQKGTIFLEGTYELIETEDGVTTKVFIPSFDAPEDSNMIHIVRFTDCSSQLDLRHWEFAQTDFLVFNQITADEMIDFVTMINEKIHAPRLKLVNQTKLILGYVFLGIVFMAIFITVIAVYTTWWLSAFVVLAYFIGLFMLQKRTGRITSEMDKVIFLNLAFVIHNLNKTLLESKFKMRCKLGHMGQWIEFHSLRRNT